MPLPRRSSAPFGWRANRQASKCHHQLSDGLAVTKRFDRLAGAIQRIGRADLGRDLVLAPPAEQLFDVLGVSLRVASHERAPEDSAYVAALEQGEVERKLRDARRESDDEEAPLPGDASQRRLGIRA